MNHLHDALMSAGAPHAPFLETAHRRIWSYADLDAATARMAAALVGLGVQPGDRVAAQVEKSPAALFLYLATVRAGGVYLPLNTAYTLSELAYFIGDAQPGLVVCDPASEERVRSIAGAARVVTLDTAGETGGLIDAAKAQTAGLAPVERRPADLAAILYTSGTTGRSKGAMLNHANLESNARTLAALWRFTPDDVLIHALPIYHIHGLFAATNTLMMAGASMLFRPRFDPAEVLGLMSRATALMGVPTFYTRLLAQPGLDAKAVSGMRLFVSGSAPLLAETHREWTARTAKPILERYGMTETGMNTSNPYEGDRIPGSVGRPLPGVEVRITDPDTGKALADGEIGMIEVRGPNVFAGYWRMPEKTMAEFRADGFFVTGDLGVIDAATGYVSIVGRGKDLIITGGFNVYPIEVEEAINALPGVVESAVIGLAHPDFGEGVTAVVADGGSGGLTEAEVIAALSQTLAKFKQPKRVIFVADLPRNAMGKVQKARLRETYAGLYG